MDQFFLQLTPKQAQPSINYNTSIFLMGSCFVENIGKKLAYHKFQNTINPFGIIFHPKAIQSLLQRIVKQHFFTEKDVFFHNEQWHCFEVHSELSNPNKEQFLTVLNNQLKISLEQLKQASHVVLTFGTAWGYSHKENNQTVANCHKVPQQQFDKQLMTVLGLEKCFLNCFELIGQLNSKAQIITTISPVRHIKDGVSENNRSKSNLLAGLHQSIENTSNTSYYPAYELMMDCLRDYRFYEADLIHPNQIAIDFIWKHFMQTWIHETTTQQTIKRISEIQRGLLHRPFNSESEGHQKFLKKLNEKIEKLTIEFPVSYTHLTLPTNREV